MVGQSIDREYAVTLALIFKSSISVINPALCGIDLDERRVGSATEATSSLLAHVCLRERM